MRRIFDCDSLSILTLHHLQLRLRNQTTHWRMRLKIKRLKFDQSKKESKFSNIWQVESLIPYFLFLIFIPSIVAAPFLFLTFSLSRFCQTLKVNFHELLKPAMSATKRITWSKLTNIEHPLTCWNKSIRAARKKKLFSKRHKLILNHSVLVQ